MNYSWVFRILGAVLLVIGIAAVGYIAYTAGLAQGQTAAPISTTAEETAVLHGPFVWHPLRGLFFLPGLLCLAPFLLCLFIFLPLRMIFGPRRMHMHMHGRWHDHGCGDEEVPAPVEEWHRRMHEEKKEKS